MKNTLAFALALLLLLPFLQAELKSTYNIPAKLSEAEMRGGPSLSGSSIYPQFGVPCTNFTYSVMYQDAQGREPEYVRINLNGQWHDMAKAGGDAKSGARYVYYFVPSSTKANFYYIEASNGIGKARAAIIDSPDQGPILYTEKFDNNQIILLDTSGNELWAYDTGADQVEGVALSKDGRYAAAVTNSRIYLFSNESGTPLWSYCESCGEPPAGSTNFAGIAISADGKYVAADMQGKLYFFASENGRPLWTRDTESSAIGVGMSADAGVIAAGVGNAGEKGDRLFLFDREGNQIGTYKASHPSYVQTGNFYQPAVTPDGKYVAVSTGCPDRRAYLFGGDGLLLFRSEQLTYDSPVHKSAISDDGSLLAYSLDHSQGKEILLLFKKDGSKLWGFSSPDDSVARGVSLSADGKYAAIGTSAGRVYLFAAGSSQPLWKFTESGLSQFGEVKLNGDGTLLAAAGTSKKIYLFSRGSGTPLWGHAASTWVTKLDFNGHYILAGTGLREYIGEGMREEKDYACTEIIQPKPMQRDSGPARPDSGNGPGENYGVEGGCESFDGNEAGCRSNPDYCRWLDSGICEAKAGSASAVCGDGICEFPESRENCPNDCCGENCGPAQAGVGQNPGGQINESDYEIKPNASAQEKEIPGENASEQPAEAPNPSLPSSNSPGQGAGPEPPKDFISQLLSFFAGLFGLG
ncbi:MAG: PQQ-binding-like beta-propeller repeat protein [Candidatus Marsarchaeota archaeon]|nr:PQQ-binding-like beta-propeller repeat protein [Candidatus Marsarchaeota archaeon]